MTEKSLHIHQDVYFLVSSLTPNGMIERKLNPGRKYYLFVIDGEIQLGSDIMKTRDAARIEKEEKISIKAVKPADVILIDLPEKYSIDQ